MLRRRHFVAEIGPLERDEWLLCFRRAPGRNGRTSEAARDHLAADREARLSHAEQGIGFMAETSPPGWTFVAAGLIGAAGVGLAAAASHAGGEALLRPASTICLAHAPALVALSLVAGRVRFAPLAALGMAVGTALFAGDLVARQFLGTGPLPDGCADRRPCADRILADFGGRRSHAAQRLTFH